MSQVLIDRAVLEATLEHAEFVSGAACEADDAIRAVLAAPISTPELPIKAYYYEAPNEYGGLNKSVGLEVRHTFIDAPLVLQSDALATIDGLRAEVGAQRVKTCAALKARNDAREECDAALVECERRQMQLAACGVVALANTIESAGEARQMHPDYMSASCSNVAGAVDREIALRTERDQQAQRIGELEGLLRHAQKQVPTGSGLHMRIDAALSAGKEGE